MRHSLKDKGQEEDLGLVYGRTPRRQKANSIEFEVGWVEHQERAPFFGFFRASGVYTPKRICVKDFLIRI